MKCVSIEGLRASCTEDFGATTRKTIFPGSAASGIKDPVLLRDQDLRIWATPHPLTEGDENANQMIKVDADGCKPRFSAKVEL